MRGEKGQTLFQEGLTFGSCQEYVQSMLMLLLGFLVYGAPANAVQSGRGMDGVDVDEAFRRALRQSETVGITEQQRVQAEEAYAQAKASLFPSIVANLSYTRQDVPSAGTASSLSPAEQRFARVQGVQPLFRGFAEYAALRQGKRTTEASELRLKHAELQLFRDVSQAFHDVLSFESDIRNYNEEIDLNRRRLKDLEGFRKIGRARPSEALTTRSNLAALEAQLEATRGALSASREVFRFLTGIAPEERLVDRVSWPTTLPAVEEYVQSLDSRPDLQAARKEWEAAGEGKTIARAGHFPSLDLIGNYYLTRPGFLSNVSWDAQLALTFPIFQGGLVNAQLRQASALEKQRELEFVRARRLAEQEVRTQYALLTAAIAQVSGLKGAVEVSRQSFEQVQRDYRLGLVTNLEVIQSLTSVETLQRQYDRSLFGAKHGYLALEAAAARRKTAK